MRFKEHLQLVEFQPLTTDEELLMEKASNLLAIGAREVLTVGGLLGKKEDMLNKEIAKKYTKILQDEVDEYKGFKTEVPNPVTKIFPRIEHSMKTKLNFDINGHQVENSFKNKRLILWLSSLNMVFAYVVEKVKDFARDLLVSVLDLLSGGLSTILNIILNIHEVGNIVNGAKKAIIEARRIFTEIDNLGAA